MAQQPLPFVHESDSEDSVATESTAPHDPETDYSVEKILRERKRDGVTQYLVKWETYPLHECTWEPVEQFSSGNDNNALRDWKLEKRNIHQGLVQPFDLRKYEDAKAKHEDAVRARKAKRAEKRARRAKREQRRERKPQRLVTRRAERSSIPPKKGIARKPNVYDTSSAAVSTVRKRKRILSESPSPARSINDLSSLFSDVEEPSKQPETSGQKASRLSPTKRSRPNRAPLDRDVTESGQTSGKVERTTTSEKPDSIALSKSAANDSNRPLTIKPKNSLADPLSLGAQNRTNVFANWNEDKTARQRQRVDEHTPKDSQDVQFVNLAQKNRFQRYSVNEPIPDASRLQSIDPSTGKLLGAIEQNTRPAPKESTNLTLETEIPARRFRRQSFESINKSARTPLSPNVPESRPARPPSIKNVMCRFWLRGKCAFDASKCKHAHFHCDDIESKRSAVCPFWRNGRCRFSSDQCEYQHSYPPWGDDARDYRIGQAENGRYRRRSNSPDNSGLRQEEVERRNRDRRRSIATSSVAAPRDESRNQATASTGAKPIPVVSPKAKPAIVRRKSAIDLQSTEEPSTHEAENGAETVIKIPARLCVRPSDSLSAVLDIHLIFDQRGNPTRFADIIGETPLFEAGGMCLEHDFRKLCFQEERAWTSGSVFSSDQPMVDDLCDYLLINHSGFMVYHKEYSYLMVIYPTKGLGWDFLPSQGPEISGLRFHVQTTLPVIPEPEPATQLVTKNSDDTTSFVTLCKEHLNLDADVIFTRNGAKKAERSVFMVYPSRDLPEAKLVETFLKEVGARVYYPSDCELYQGFCREGKGSRVIIFHPDMFRYWEIPAFYSVLQGSDNVFQLGIDPSLQSCPQAATRFSCVRLFPFGSLTLVTDEVFKYSPGLAFQVLDYFEKVARSRPRGGRTERLCTRPGLIPWLAQLIVDDDAKGMGIPYENSDRVKVWRTACNLFDLEANDTSTNPYRADPFPPSVLYSPPKDEFPTYAGLWDSSEEDATDELVQWFCGFCISEREHFRRFTVIYEQNRGPARTPGVSDFKDPKDWMKKNQHVFVLDPKRWLNREEQKKHAKR